MGLRGDRIELLSRFQREWWPNKTTKQGAKAHPKRQPWLLSADASIKPRWTAVSVRGTAPDFDQWILPFLVPGVQLIRRYGLYSSRIKGRWPEMTYVVERAPSGWKASHEVATDDPEGLGFEPLSESETVEVDADCRKQSWARLLAKVYDGYAPRSIRLSGGRPAFSARIRSRFGLERTVHASNRMRG